MSAEKIGQVLVIVGMLAAAVVSGACDESPTTPSPLPSIPAGIWGGQHMGLSVTASGAAAEFDCAQGAIDQPIMLDGQGRFDVSGTFVLEAGGPIHPDQIRPSQRARYTGSATGTKIRMRVHLPDSDLLVGEFDLVLGAQARFLKCL